jgi:hypothetical protein
MSKICTQRDRELAIQIVSMCPESSKETMLSISSGNSSVTIKSAPKLDLC